MNLGLQAGRTFCRYTAPPEHCKLSKVARYIINPQDKALNVTGIEGDDFHGDGIDGEARKAFDAGFFHDVFTVTANGMDADAEFLGDLFVGESLHQADQHIALTFGELLLLSPLWMGVICLLIFFSNSSKGSEIENVSVNLVSNS